MGVGSVKDVNAWGIVLVGVGWMTNAYSTTARNVIFTGIQRMNQK